jgi:hypothetical protein
MIAPHAAATALSQRFGTFRTLRANAPLIGATNGHRVARRTQTIPVGCRATLSSSQEIPMSRKSKLVSVTLTAFTLSALLSSAASAAHFGGGGFGFRHPAASFHRPVAIFHRAITGMKKIGFIAGMKKVEPISGMKKVEPLADMKKVEPISGMKKVEPISGMKKIELISGMKKIDRQPVVGMKKIEHRRDGANPPLNGETTVGVNLPSQKNPPWGNGCEACPPHHIGPTTPILQALPGRNLASVGAPIELWEMPTVEVPEWVPWTVVAISPATVIAGLGIRSLINNIKDGGSPAPRAESGGGGGGSNLDGGTPITVEAAQKMSGAGNTDQPASDAGAHTDSGETGSADAAAKVDGGV